MDQTHATVTIPAAASTLLHLANITPDDLAAAVLGPLLANASELAEFLADHWELDPATAERFRRQNVVPMHGTMRAV